MSQPRLSPRCQLRSPARSLAALLIMVLVGGAAGLPGAHLVWPSSVRAQAQGLGAPQTLAVRGSADFQIFLPAVRRAPQPELPSAQELIAAALDAGRIDYGTSLLYRAYAFFGDARLPEEFRGGGSSGEDPSLFVEIQRASATLPAELLAQLRPFTLRPEHPESIFNTTPEAVAATPAAPQALPCNGGWASQATAPPARVKVWAKCTGNYTFQITQTVAFAEVLWGPMTALMGPPQLDAGGPDGGGDDAIDLYVVRLGQTVPRGAGGDSLAADTAGSAVETSPASGHTSSAYILLERPGTDAAPVSKGTLAHELFHVLQSAHNRAIMFRNNAAGTGLDEFWFVEASAEWAVAHFVPEDRWGVHRRFLDFQDSRQSLHASTALPDEHMYDAYIWPFFMQHERGAETIADAWRGIATVADETDWDAANDVIDLQLPFAEHFQRFALRNLNSSFDGSKPITPLYIDLDPDFPNERMPPGKLLELLPQDPSDPPVVESVSINSLSTEYYEMLVAGCGGTMELDFSGLTPQESLSADAVVRDRSSGRWSLQPVPDDGTLTVSDADQLWLVVSNHDKDLNTEVTGNLQIRWLSSGDSSSGGRVIAGDVTITNTAALEALAGVEEITGSLSIQGPEVTGLAPLRCLRTVGGALSIGATGLSDLTGLNSLTSVGQAGAYGGSLAIGGNASLTSLDGLNALRRVGGSLEIGGNGALTTLDGLGALIKVGGHVRVSGEALTSVGGLRALADIDGELILDSLQGYKAMATFELPALVYVNGAVRIYEYVHPGTAPGSVTTISFPALLRVGSLTIGGTSNGVLTTVALPALITVSDPSIGDLVVGDVGLDPAAEGPALERLELSSLEYVARDFDIWNTPRLSQLSVGPATIKRDFRIVNNESLSLDAIESGTVERDLQIQGNAAFTDEQAQQFAERMTVGRYTSISGNGPAGVMHE